MAQGTSGTRLQNPQLPPHPRQLPSPRPPPHRSTSCLCSPLHTPSPPAPATPWEERRRLQRPGTSLSMCSRTGRSNQSCSCARSHHGSRDKARSTETLRGTFHRGARPQADTTHAFRSRIGGRAAARTARASRNSERNPLESNPLLYSLSYHVLPWMNRR